MFLARMRRVDTPLDETFLKLPIHLVVGKNALCGRFRGNRDNTWVWAGMDVNPDDPRKCPTCLAAYKRLNP